jgi:polysaccharide deacetylase family protein (PEP-CTERM system associated)
VALQGVHDVSPPTSGAQFADESGSRWGMFTVDVEDWYHPLEKRPDHWHGLEDRVESSTDRLLRLLAEGGNTATFFVLGHVAERHPGLVAKIAASGHEVGTHGHFHRSLEWLDPREFRDDLQRSLRALSRAGAREVISYRAPYFSLNDKTAWALPILAEAGIRIDSSTFPLWTGSYGSGAIPNRPHRRGPIWEVPVILPTVAGLRLPLSGGFYCRLFPASLTTAGIGRVLAAGSHPVFYIHPWELDPGHPWLWGDRFRTLRHYLRLGKTEGLVRRVLTVCRWRHLSHSLLRRES